TLLFESKRPKDTREAYEKAVAIYERLQASSNAPQHAINLAGAYCNLGILIGDDGQGNDGQLEESLPGLTKSIDILDLAVRKEPKFGQARVSLCNAYWSRATMLAGLKRFPQAVSDWDRAIELDDGRNAVLLRMKRASTLLDLKDHVRA